jgi:hypothetical protein
MELLLAILPLNEHSDRIQTMPEEGAGQKPAISGQLSAFRFINRQSTIAN